MGGYGTHQGLGFTAYEKIGTGLSNTNILISKNLQPDTSGWPVVWDWIEEFRSSRSNDWFLPSRQEINCVYNNSLLLNNISYNTNYYYWSSSEYNKNLVYIFNFRIGDETGNDYKNYHYNRCRLCRYTKDSELNPYEKKIWTTDEIITSSELNRIENKIQEIYSSYSPTSWISGDVLSKDRLNKIETQLGTDKVWEDGNVVTVDDLNNIENLLI